MTVAPLTAGASGRIARIMLAAPLPEPFDYLEPSGLDLEIGDVVSVPLGSRTVRGVVVDFRSAIGANRPLKPVAARVDAPPLSAKAIEFLQWAARYAVDSPGQPLAIALRGLNAPPPRTNRKLTVGVLPPAPMTKSRARAIEAARSPADRGELAKRAGVSPGVIKALIDLGALVEVENDAAGPEIWIGAHQTPGQLDPGQEAAVAQLSHMLAVGGFNVALLDGVTGSGKTEVYLEAAARVLARDATSQVLVLLPEIALTHAAIDRISARFGVSPAEWHSGVSPSKRRKTWESVADGTARRPPRARSALFLPFRKLGLVVVDEEHDGSYKQTDGFIYQARDLAVMRAKIESCLAVLASATPSLETIWNAQSGRYHWLRLGERHGDAELPDIELIDLRTNPPPAGRWLSPLLKDEMAKTLARGEQTLLFLNRRGYAPFVLCRACGDRLKSPDSDSWLVEHRYTGKLVCHLTGFQMAKPTNCPYCGAANTLVSIGPGVERVEEEVRGDFPEARVAVFSSDTVTDQQSARELVDSMARGDIDILVATQSAAKGHNFPRLTLVGVVDGDLGLRGGDLRAAERTHQLLTQVTGRAGRHALAGRALIQTWNPDHEVMRTLASGDRDAFIALELAERKAVGLPPFGRLAALILTGLDHHRVEAVAQAMAAAAPNAFGVRVYGPADPAIPILRGRRRKRLLVSADRNVDVQAFIATWISRAKPPASVNLTVDIDPYSFW